MLNDKTLCLYKITGQNERKSILIRDGEFEMPIQIIIFITKSKIFACEIRGSDKVDRISINGNLEIKCESIENIDEVVRCILDFYNIDSFADENFDMIILEAGASRELVKYLEEKCAQAKKLNIYSIEKILSVVLMNKDLIRFTKDSFITFAEQYYKISFSDNNILKIKNVEKNDNIINLCEQDFIWFYYPAVVLPSNNIYKKHDERNDKDALTTKHRVSTIANIVSKYRLR